MDRVSSLPRISLFLFLNRNEISENFDVWESKLFCKLENNIWQGVRPGLGAHLRFMHDLPLLIIDLLRLLVAQQENNAAQ